MIIFFSYTGHTQYTDFKQVIEGNKKNHTVAHRNAKFRADSNDQNEADKQYVAASHFHFIQWMCPKTTLILIKIAKILESKGIFVVFESASQATWSRLLRYIRGGFIQIPEEFMTNPVLEDFRQDFGLANPDLPKNPTILDILGNNN